MNRKNEKDGGGTDIRRGRHRGAGAVVRTAGRKRRGPGGEDRRNRPGNRIRFHGGGTVVNGTTLSVMPTRPGSVFDKYRVVLTPTGGTALTDAVEETLDIGKDEIPAGGSLLDNKELVVGTWRVEVTAYQTFADGEGTKDYDAATGTATVVIETGDEKPVEVKLAPITSNNAAKPGIFSYKIGLTGVSGVTGTIELKKGTAAPTTIDLAEGLEGLKEVSPGTYNLTLSLKNGDRTAGLFEKVYVYSGFESKLEAGFGAADFTENVYITGKFTNAAAFKEKTVRAYRDTNYRNADSAIPGAEAVVDDTGAWSFGVPGIYVGQPVYLAAVTKSDEDGKITEIYTAGSTELNEVGHKAPATFTSINTGDLDMAEYYAALSGDGGKVAIEHPAQGGTTIRLTGGAFKVGEGNIEIAEDRTLIQG